MIKNYLERKIKMTTWNLIRLQLGKTHTEMAKDLGISKQRWHNFTKREQIPLFYIVCIYELAVVNKLTEYLDKFIIFKERLDKLIDSDLYEQFKLKKGEKL